MNKNQHISLRITLYKQSKGGDLRPLVSYLQGKNIRYDTAGEHSGDPDRVQVFIGESLHIGRGEVGDENCVTSSSDISSPKAGTSLDASPSKIAESMSILSLFELDFEKLEVYSTKRWLGFKSSVPTRHLILRNVWVGAHPKTLEKLVKLNLDCDFLLHDSGPLTGEWLLTMLNETKNLEECYLHLEQARIVGSNVHCPSEVTLEKIKNFEVSHHCVQIHTLFSKLSLPEDAKIKITTSVENARDLARVVFPPEWPTSARAWEQQKLKVDVSKEVDMSKEVVTYSFDRNSSDRIYTVTVKHEAGFNPQSPVPPVITSHGNPEGRLKEMEISFTRELGGFSPGSEWWNNILISNPKLDNLIYSGGEIQGLCEALCSELEFDGVKYYKCPNLRRLELGGVDPAADATVCALARMLATRKEFGYPIKELCKHSVGPRGEKIWVDSDDQSIYEFCKVMESRGTC